MIEEIEKFIVGGGGRMRAGLSLFVRERREKAATGEVQFDRETSSGDEFQGGRGKHEAR